MKKLGIVGGMGSVAAAYFFSRLVTLTPSTTDQGYIETVLHNNPRVPDRTRHLFYGEESPLPEIKRSVALLNAAEVDYIVLACLTSHAFLPELQKGSKAEILNAVEETVKYISLFHCGIEYVGIMASTGALKAELFQKSLANEGIKSIVLNDPQQASFFMEPVYADWGIKAGNISGQPRDRLLQGIDTLISSGAQVVIAGCSELPTVLTQSAISVPLIDAIDVLLSIAIKKCLEIDHHTVKFPDTDLNDNVIFRNVVTAGI